VTCDLITLNTTEDSKKKKKKASRKHSIILQKTKICKGMKPYIKVGYLDV
jgi:hypothetical protein